MSEPKEKNMPEEKLPETKLPESASVSEEAALSALADAILATDEPEEIADVPEDDGFGSACPCTTEGRRPRTRRRPARRAFPT